MLSRGGRFLKVCLKFAQDLYMVCLIFPQCLYMVSEVNSIFKWTTDLPYSNLDGMLVNLKRISANFKQISRNLPPGDNAKLRDCAITVSKTLPVTLLYIYIFVCDLWNWILQLVTKGRSSIASVVKKWWHVILIVFYVL